MKENFHRIIFLILGTFLSCAGPFLQGNKEKEKKAEVYYNFGTNQLVNKDYTGALKHLLMANELDPQNPKILNNLGMAYYLKGKTDTAIQYFQKSIKEDPKNSDARNNLASLYLDQQKFKEAEEEYKQILEDLIYDKQYRVYYNLGLLKLEQGYPRDAKDFFEKSIQDFENYCPAHFQLGLLLFRKRQFKSAYEKFYTASLGTCYAEPAPQYYQGLALLKAGDLEKSRNKFQEITERFPKTQYAHLSLMRLKNWANVHQDSFSEGEDQEGQKIKGSFKIADPFIPQKTPSNNTKKGLLKEKFIE